MTDDLKDILVELAFILEKYDAYMSFDGTLELVVDADNSPHEHRNWEMFDEYIDADAVKKMIEELK